MKYYLIFLQSGTVVDICSFDEMTSRDNAWLKYVTADQNIINGVAYDEVQHLDIVL